MFLLLCCCCIVCIIFHQYQKKKGKGQGECERETRRRRVFARVREGRWDVISGTTMCYDARAHTSKAVMAFKKVHVETFRNIQYHRVH